MGAVSYERVQSLQRLHSRAAAVVGVAAVHDQLPRLAQPAPLFLALLCPAPRGPPRCCYWHCSIALLLCVCCSFVPCAQLATPPSPLLSLSSDMPRKRKSDGGRSEQKEKRQRNEPAAGAVPPLMDQAQFDREHANACHQLARLLSNADSRPLDERAADVFKLLQADEKREEPLIDLSHEREVRSSRKRCCTIVRLMLHCSHAFDPHFCCFRRTVYCSVPSFASSSPAASRHQRDSKSERRWRSTALGK